MTSLAFTSSAQVLSISSAYGVNLTGNERTWDCPTFDVSKLEREIKRVEDLGLKAVRLPISFRYHLKSDPDFGKKLRRLLRSCAKVKIELILANFDHQLSEEHLEEGTFQIIDQWMAVLDILPKNTKGVFLEIVNEPTISPSSWYKASMSILSEIRKRNNEISIIVGASNANSMFELSRMKPYPFKNLIYTFHYYEPYIFTHQGTSWTGDQHATVGIPYPYDEEMMPVMNTKVKGTSGEVNFRDYDKTGNIVAVEDKISQIFNWAKTHDVIIWCTEYGVTENADRESRINYLNDVSQILRKYSIPSFLWEWEGNFGVKEIMNLSNK
ncbi:glycoside hydrolase family 5 protein [Belliella sp. DSM 111904]|uniref:Glycoside hydrolase family 5 protein n=1 Tax=Belliella filtrata TaxID=2923435 RepID=A0ABS9UXI0_9BACT|nr:cellulase family glycosylhydrolase [Belliella filtrata]MCH7408892.1 glycoside hydrolase family 5 protein [Belliella filtrata]